MKVDFRRLTWENYPSTETPINADNLNRLEEGVAGLYSDVAEMEEKMGDNVGEYVTDWLTEHVDPVGSAVVVDNALSIAGAAADAKKTGDEISSLKEDSLLLDDRITALEGGGSGSGLTEDIKAAMLQIASKVAYIDAQGQTYYDAMYNALYPPADLVSISAVYTQSGTVHDTDTLDSLKDDLVVTAHMSDQTTRVVTTYTLSGTLVEGTSTITVAYGGKTTTFNVIVSGEPVSDETKWTNGVSYTYTPVDNKYVTRSGTITSYNGWSMTPYLYCSGASKLTFTALGTGGNYNESNLQYNCFYDANKTFLSAFGITGLGTNIGDTCDVVVPENAVYFIASGSSIVYGSSSMEQKMEITPYA